VRDAYGIRATGLTFIPVGYAAACYRLDSGNGPYFLKVWPGAAHNPARERALRLSHALHERGILPHVSYPLPTRDGALSATGAAAAFALFPFIKGVAPRDPWPEWLQDAWAETLAHLHRATPRLADIQLPREDFSFPLAARLEDSLARLGPDTRPELRALRDTLLAGRGEIAAQLVRLDRLRETVRQLNSPFVLCHTDMGGDNLLLDGDRLYVLDWDEALLAPPEHDLHEARWIAPGRMLRSYHEIGGAWPLHLEHFEFCILRRALGDMTVRVARALETQATDWEIADALNGIERWGFAQWRALDATLARLAPALEAADSSG
jgi:Ser/Thr protein kinase RdoA (MazF antagonist)